MSRKPQHPMGWNQYTDQDQAERISEKLRACGFEYVGGYSDRKSRVTVRCLDCGHVFDRVYEALVETRWNSRCPVCKAQEDALVREQKRQEKEAKKKAERQAKQEIAQAVRNAKYRIDRFLDGRFTFESCCVCESTKSKASMIRRGRNYYCSDECFELKQRERKAKDNLRRDHRLDKCKKKDGSINLIALYRRDGGTCWICGQQTDLDDKAEWEDGTIVCGENYPSIDHIIPVYQGGDHLWNNVRLAHRGCNRERYQNETYPAPWL